MSTLTSTAAWIRVHGGGGAQGAFLKKKNNRGLSSLCSLFLKLK